MMENRILGKGNTAEVIEYGILYCAFFHIGIIFICILHMNNLLY